MIFRWMVPTKNYLKIALKHKEIRIFRNSRNYGVGYVRNKIIEAARGVFLAFDDDDESVRNRLELQYKRIIDYENNCSQSSHNLPLIEEGLLSKWFDS